MKQRAIIVLTLILILSTVVACAEDMPIIPWPDEPILTPGPYSLNTTWKAIDWSNNEDEQYFVFLTNGLGDDCIRDFLIWLNTDYSIPCLAYQVSQEEARRRIHALLEEDPRIAGILMYGFDWMAINDAIQECTERAMPVWISEKAEYNEMTKELEGLFGNTYKKNS